MIMLPLHGQDTAAIETCHWAGWTFDYISRGGVFVKQAGILFAEFLIKLLLLFNFYYGVYRVKKLF